VGCFARRVAPRKRKATLHSAGRVTEAEIIGNARALAQDPSPVVPVWEGGFLLFNPVTAARKGVLRAHAARDDPEALQRLSTRGNDLARAVAATLLLANAEKLPFVADLRMPFGNVPYVIRGKAKPFFLAGVQHHDDRRLRLLCVTPWVKKRGLHFWSCDRGLVCTGKREAPPRDFVEEELAALGLAPQGGSSTYSCGHDEEDVVVLDWRAAGVEARRCLACADDENTLHRIVEHVAAPRPSRMFDVRATLRPLRAAAGGAAPEDAFELPEATVAEYRAGRAGDRAVIEAARGARIASLRKRAGALFVTGNESYGADAEAFLAALRPTEAEARALRAAFAAHGAPVVLDRASAARALAELWPTQGRTMVEAAARDAEVAGRLHREGVTADEAAELIRRAAREGASRSVDAQLPRYGNLPPVAAAADAIARAYRGEGPEAAARVAVERASAGKAKGVALAALETMGAGAGQEWRFGPTDRELAQALAGPAERLLKGDPASYHESLELVSRLSGETATFAPRK
jgi:hypothetical protein